MSKAIFRPTASQHGCKRPDKERLHPPLPCIAAVHALGGDPRKPLETEARIDARGWDAAAHGMRIVGLLMGGPVAATEREASSLWAAEELRVRDLMEQETTVSASGISLAAERRLESFVRQWRALFVHSTHPRFLPPGWSVDYDVLRRSSDERDVITCATPTPDDIELVRQRILFLRSVASISP